MTFDSTNSDLSARERDVLIGLAKGFTYSEIGALLGVSDNTIRTHIRGLYRKLSVNSRAEAVFEAMQSGLLKLA